MNMYLIGFVKRRTKFLLCLFFLTELYAAEKQYITISSESCDTKLPNKTTNSVSFCFNLTYIDIPTGYTIVDIDISIFNFQAINRRHIKNAIRILGSKTCTQFSGQKFVKLDFVDLRRRKRIRRNVEITAETENCIMELRIENLSQPKSDLFHGNMTIEISKPVCTLGTDCPLLDDASVALLETNTSNCMGSCKTLPENTGALGYITLSKSHQHETLNTSIIYGSGYGCTFVYSVWIHPEINITVSLHTASIHKVIDFQQFKIFDRKWHDVKIRIGKIDEPFHISVKVGSMYHVAMRSFALAGCGEELPNSCDRNQLKCSTGHCLNQTSVCDLREQCFYGDDESYDRCGASDVFSRCDFDTKSCGWTTNDDEAKCQWRRKRVGTEFVSFISNGSYNMAWFLYGSDCERENRAAIVLPLKAMKNATNCNIRLYYLISGKASIFIRQCKEENYCEQLSSIHGGKSDRKWNSYSLSLPTQSARFELLIHGEFSDHRPFTYIVVDDISLTGDCFALDTADIRKQNLHSQQQSNQSEAVLIVVGISLGIISGCIIIIGAVLVCRRKNTKDNQRTYRKISTNSTASSLLFGIRKTNSKDVCYDNETGHPFLTGTTGMSSVSPLYDWQQVNDIMHIIPRNKITIKRMLGKGAFGEVYYGLLADVARLQTSLPVAIKMLPTLCPEQSKSEFFVEAVLLSKLRHPNIVRFLGISLDDNTLYLLLELMEGGDMRSFVRECRINREVPTVVSANDLLKLCLDVANGCEYLEQNKFIHRDIAARNCLLTERGPNRIAKIADFGMTKNVFSTNYYRKNGMAMVPVKWMPPEAFHDGVFTSKTDVWGFGIVLWEVFTLGYIPYPGKSNNEVMAYVAKGGRLDKPELCSEQLFKLMLQCWEELPDQRPNFKYIASTIKDIKERQPILSEENIIYCEIDSRCTAKSGESSDGHVTITSLIEECNRKEADINSNGDHSK